jgi:PTS system nitrogen regulatory IIA component
MLPEPLWTVADVAAYLSVSERTVRDWQARRRLPHLRIGGTIRFRPDEVQAWASRFEEAEVTPSREI